MLTIETEIVIAAPARQVWDILSDLGGYADWNPYLVRIEGRAAVGDEIIVHSRSADGRTTSQPIRVVLVDPQRAMRWEGGLPDRDLFLGDHWWILADMGAATLLRQFEHFSGSMAAAILAEHGRDIRENFIRFNEALRAQAEGLTA